MSVRRDVTKWVWLSVITTNAGNEDVRVPVAEDEWNRTDRRAVERLAAFAERVGTYVQRSSQRLL